MKSYDLRKILKSALLFTILATVFMGCSTPKKTAIQRIEVGMDKSDVLELAGNPTRKGRAMGMDRWVYEYDTDSGKETTYVFFEGGFVRYSGPSEPPSNKDFKTLPDKPDSDTNKNSGFKNLSE